MHAVTPPLVPAIVQSPALDYPPEGWPRASLELHLWRTTITNVTLVWAVVSSNSDLRLRRIIHTRKYGEGACAYQNVIDTVEVQMPRSTHRTLLANLAAISFPAFATKRMGFDGETRGIEMGDFPSNIRVDWWQGAPTGWEALEAWRAETEATFEELLPPVPHRFNIGYRYQRK